MSTKHRIREAVHQEAGAALPFVAVILVLLLGMAAFAIDLGWLYLNGARVQRAADSASLAGVIHLPSFPDKVTAQAVRGATANGYDIGSVNGKPVGGGGVDNLAWRAVSDNRLEVTLSSSIPTFFMKIFGFESFEITRVSTAEYVKPVPMGSPSSCFGIGPSAAGSLGANGLGHCAGFTMNFWAAINGTLTAKEHGDPFAVSCITADDSGCTGAVNPDERSIGYFYGIDIPSEMTGSITVKLFDAAYYQRPTQQTETGDRDMLTNSADGGVTTQYFLYAPDLTPLNPRDNLLNTPVCSTSPLPPETTDGGTWMNVWRDLCTIPVPVPGIYVLNVRSTGGTGGNNSYSIGIGGSANPHPQIFAIDDMSIYTNDSGGSATVYLAEVDPVHKDKQLELRFYDPGENNADAWVEVKMPNGDTPNCSWTARDESGATTASGSGTCRIKSTIGNTAQFNAQWLTAIIRIPNNYECTDDCFWKMKLDMANSHDRTTWTARIIGNPVHLTPNE